MKKGLLQGRIRHPKKIQFTKGIFLKGAMGMLLSCLAFLILLEPSYIQAAGKEQDRRITFISPFANSGYWGTMAHGIITEGDLLGYDTKCVSFSDGMETDLASALWQAVYSDVSGIILWGEANGEAEEAANYAASHGIPVVLVDNDNERMQRICYIGTDNEEAGRMAGRDMCEGVSEELHILAIVGDEEMENQAHRLQGFSSEVSKYPGCTVDVVVESEYSTLQVKRLLPKAFAANPSLNAVFCAEGYSSAIAGEVLNVMGFQPDQIRVVTFDQSEEILSHVESGRYISTIVQQSDRMGQMAVQVLSSYLEGEALQEDVIYTQCRSIHKENLEEVTRYDSEGVIWHLWGRNIKRIPWGES